MNSERATAYSRVVATIEDVGTVKLQPAEIERLRQAADTLLFSDGLDGAGGAALREALEDIEELTDNLVASGRWTDESAARLFDDLAECGPVATARR